MYNGIDKNILFWGDKKMNIVDGIIIGLLVLGGINGFRRGLLVSIFELLKEPGYPHTFVAIQGGELKLSKQLLKKGFLDVVAHYNSRG